MSLSLKTVRWLAPASFVYNFAAQLYGIVSSPSMKEIHDANLSFFSPQPYFIAAFFFPQQVLQLWWLWRLYRVPASSPRVGGAPAAARDAMVHFAPYLVLGNACLGTWMFFWMSEQLAVADAFVAVNAAAQLWYVFAQLSRLHLADRHAALTHAVAKSFAGIAVLDLLHNSSVAFFKDQAPARATQVLTGVAFAALSAASDWILGACLVYDLVALSVGQAQYGEPGWSHLLALYAVGSTAIVAVKNYARPPYTSSSGGYVATAQDQPDDTV